MTRTCRTCPAELEEWRASPYCYACAKARRESPKRPRTRKTPGEAAAQRRAADKRKRDALRAEKIAGRMCVMCEGPVPPEMKVGRKTCSDACRLARDNQVSREYYYARSGGAPKGSPAANERMAEAGRRRWSDGLTFKSRECRACGSVFVPTAGPQRYCTPQCLYEARSAGRYGLTVAEMKAIIERQGGACAVCGVTGRGWARTTRRKDQLVVDHCHETGKVRGFLCGDCNTALGRFGDDPARLRKAIEYLERC